MAEETPRVKGFRDFMRRSGWATLAILFVVTGLGAGIYALLSSNKSNNTQNQQNQLTGTKLSGFKPVSTVTKLQATDTQPGTGKEAKSGSLITVQYIGALAKDGTIFDTTLDSGTPASFTLKAGPGGVIKGFADGLTGMRVGGVREIYIPADEGYGATGHPPSIPPNADLFFRVSLVAVQ